MWYSLLKNRQLQYQSQTSRAVVSSWWTEWRLIIVTKPAAAATSGSARTRTYCHVDGQVAVFGKQCCCEGTEWETLAGADDALDTHLNTVWCALPRQSATTFPQLKPAPNIQCIMSIKCPFTVHSQHSTCLISQLAHSMLPNSTSLPGCATLWMLL